MTYLREAQIFPNDFTGFANALCKTDRYGQSALHIACQQGKTEPVKILLKIARRENCLERLFRIQDNTYQTFLFHLRGAGKGLFDLLIEEVTNLDMEKLQKGTVTRQSHEDGKYLLTHDLLTDKDTYDKSVLEYISKEEMRWYAEFLDPFYEYNKSLFGQTDKISKRFFSRHNLSNHSSAKDGEILKMPPQQFHLFNKSYKNHREKLNSSLLRVMGKANCIDLINHEYTKSYLRACWWQFAWLLYHGTLVVYVVLLASLIANRSRNKE